MTEEQQLSKKERRELKKLQQRAEREQQTRVGQLKRGLILLLILGLVAGVGYKGYKSITAEKPGIALADQGREHVAAGTAVEYNSNPPTSGPHYTTWTKRGMYEEPIEDGYLIHSLEHGYVVISYN